MSLKESYADLANTVRGDDRHNNNHRGMGGGGGGHKYGSGNGNHIPVGSYAMMGSNTMDRGMPPPAGMMDQMPPFGGL
jgi:hypothetical protein